MSAMCVGLIVAIILVIFVLIWITYCMFCKERHRSEMFQYSIGDLLHRNQIEDQNLEQKKEKGLAAGIFILPSRQKHKDDEYDMRPDYPESPAPIVQSGADDLIKILNESAMSSDEIDRSGNTLEIGSNSQYHSEV